MPKTMNILTRLYYLNHDDAVRDFSARYPATPKCDLTIDPTDEVYAEETYQACGKDIESFLASFENALNDVPTDEHSQMELESRLINIIRPHISNKARRKLMKSFKNKHQKTKCYETHHSE